VERELRSSSSDKTFAKMGRYWDVMRDAVAEGLALEGRSLMGLSGGDARSLLQHMRGCPGVGLAELAAAKAVAVSEINATTGLIIAAPTGGARGIIPGILSAYEQLHPGIPPRRIVEALLVAALVCMILYDDVPTAGAAFGCQAEVGVGAAMGAAALAHLEGGDPEAAIHAATLALKNSMGLVCDPVAGLVEVPCVKRNGLYAAVAVVAARIGLAGVRSAVSPDEVVLAVREVGEKLRPEYKKTSRGGLATTRDGKAVARKFAETCRAVFR
jgi:L-serine dehydratase